MGMAGHVPQSHRHTADPELFRKHRTMGETQRTSATAVQFFSQSVAASCSVDFPAFSRCLCNHSSPTCEWLRGALPTGPRECFEVIKSFFGLRAAMKIMQPFDFNERV